MPSKCRGDLGSVNLVRTVLRAQQGSGFHRAAGRDVAVIAIGRALLMAFLTGRIRNLYGYRPIPAISPRGTPLLGFRVSSRSYAAGRRLREHRGGVEGRRRSRFPVGRAVDAQ